MNTTTTTPSTVADDYSFTIDGVDITSANAPAPAAPNETSFVTEAAEWTADTLSVVTTAALDATTTIVERSYADVKSRVVDIKKNWSRDIELLMVQKQKDLDARRARMLAR